MRNFFPESPVSIAGRWDDSEGNGYVTMLCPQHCLHLWEEQVRGKWHIWGSQVATAAEVSKQMDRTLVQAMDVK